MKLELSQIADLFDKLAKHEEAILAINTKIDLVGSKIRNHLQKDYGERNPDCTNLLMDVLNVFCPEEIQPQNH